MQKLIEEFNKLGIPDMPTLTKLYGHKGDFVNHECKLPNGQIAKILDVSPDWLSGLDVPVEENTTPTDDLVLNDGEKALVKLFRLASPYQREIILQLLAAKITPKE